MDPASLLHSVSRMSQFLLFSLALSAAALCQCRDTPEPVKVSVYYETLCPDSARFFTTQLYPVWSDLKDIITLDVNARGKSTVSHNGDGYSFQCQHGPQECEGNTMVSCAKKYITDEDQFMFFSNCIMTKLAATQGGPECAGEVGANWDTIEACYNSAEGQELQYQVSLKQDALHPALNSVPWILINDVFSSEQLAAAQEDLRKVVRQAYQGNTSQSV